MTTVMQERISDDEAAILRSWLSGNNITDIAKARRTTQETVAATIKELCDYNRERGRQVLDTGVRPTPLPDRKTPTRKAAPAPPAELPTQPASADMTLARSADKVLTRAEQSTAPRVRAAAAQIRQQLTALVGLLDEAEIEAAARALVEQKRRELVAAEERLRTITSRGVQA